MPINYQPDATIKTSDSSRAAILMALGVPLIDVETRGTVLIFVWDNTEDKAKIASGAVINNTPIPIGTYLDAVRKCREILSTHLLLIRGTDKKSETPTNKHGIRRLENTK